MIRVLVADNSGIHTQLLAHALTRDPELEVIAFQGDATHLVSTARRQKIDVLVLSSTLDEKPSRGFEILYELRSSQTEVRAVVLPDSSKAEAIVEAFRAGARGVFGRNEPIESLSECVRSVHEGEIWASKRNLGIAIGALASSPTFRAVNAEGMNLLSERELQVVHGLAEGLSNREIADRLRLSQHTVKNYLFRVFDKLGVSSRVELLFMTLSQGATERTVSSKQSGQKDIGDGYSRDEVNFLKKSAEAGVPAAQLALAQLYLSRRDNPQDLVDAYMWYLVATKRALEARDSITKNMSEQQIKEATQKATVWLSRGKRQPNQTEGGTPRTLDPTG